MISTIFDLPPGSIVVVGPKGRLALSLDDTGKINFHASNCDFIGPSGASVAHRAIVNERWEMRDEDGRLVQEAHVGSMADLPDWFADLACRPPPPPKKHAWWKFWMRGVRP